MHLCSTNLEGKTLQLRYKQFQAQIDDTKRKFELAAWKYYAISNQEEVVQDAKLNALRSAILCAILSPAGDTKYKLLSVLSKDERSRTLSPHSELLEKLYLGHIIKKGDT